MPVLKVSGEVCVALYSCKKGRNSLTLPPSFAAQNSGRIYLSDPTSSERQALPQGSRSPRGPACLLLPVFSLPFFFAATGEALAA